MQTLPPGPAPSMLSPKSPSTPSPRQPAVQVDQGVWSAVAGASVRIPRVTSYVCYFPQGHLEQCHASSNATTHNFNLVRPWIPCQVISVHFLSDPVSDLAYASIVLQPLHPLSPPPMSAVIDGSAAAEDDIISFAKILTRSDANNGGGFSVPRFCADMILPQLNFAKDPPVQKLFLMDTLSNTWEFRHIYRGTPRRHLLTTGWSKYVNAKKLVAGDSVVFMRRKSTNQLFIGVRRAAKFEGDGDGEGGDEVVKAIENATRGIPFEVLYYPKIGVPDFVVQAEKVKEALRIPWSTGMRVRMAVETDDSSRMTWIQGVVNALNPPATGIWCGSPWRMLKVKWDDPEISRNFITVSPWEVEYTPLSPLIDADFPPKRFKLMQDYGMTMLPNDIPVQETTPHSSIAELSTAALLNYSPFPAGMQGARRDHNTVTSPNGGQDPPWKEYNLQQLVGVSTVLTMGSSSSTTAGGGQTSSSFQLFGTTILASSSGNEEDDSD